jgi:hypothetical protein
MFLVIGQWNGLLQFLKKDNKKNCALGTTINYFLVQWALYIMKSHHPK